MDGLERVSVQPVEPLSPFVTHFDRPHFSEHPQVLGHLGLGQPEPAHQVVHGAFAVGVTAFFAFMIAGFLALVPVEDS